MLRVLIDGDPGHDDVLAFLVAVAHDDYFDIAGYTTVAGNSSVENCSRNILKVQDYLGLHIPVASGYSQPLTRELDTASRFHGPSGLDGAAFLDEPFSKPDERHAVEFLKDKLMETEQKTTLITMGPLTNVAVLLKTYPFVKQRIDRIAMMGGCFSMGNALPKSEFNIYHDPEAAKIVFESGVPIVMASIEACFASGILLKDNELLKDGGKVSTLGYRILQFYTRYARENGWDRTPIFDVTPVIYLLRPELFTSQLYDVQVERTGEITRGMTVCDSRGPVYCPQIIHPVDVLMDCNREEFSDEFFSCFRKLDERFGK